MAKNLKNQKYRIRMKEKNKLAGLLASLYFGLFPPGSKAETRTYYVYNKPVKVEAGSRSNCVDFKVEYETISNLSKMKGILDITLGKTEFLYLSAYHSSIWLVIPKAAKVESIQQEVMLYNTSQTRAYSKIAPPPTKFEKTLEAIATKLFLGSLGVPSIAIKIGEELKRGMEQEEKEFVNNLAKEEKGYAVEINLNDYIKEQNELEMGREINICFGASPYVAQMLNKVGNVEGRGIIYFKLVFGKNLGPALSELKAEDQIPFSFVLIR
jgi:hypothetical protein